MSKVHSGPKQVPFHRDVYETRKACEVALVQWMEQKARNKRDAGIKVFSRGEDIPDDYQDRYMMIDKPLRRVTEVFKDTGDGGSLVTNLFTCLPGTLDPRGPKGK